MDGTLSREQAAELLVAEVMIAKPKTLPSTARVADVRRVFEKKNVRTVLLVEGQEFRGAIERDSLPLTAADDEPALRFADAEPLTTTPDTPMREVLPLLDGREEPRLIVLDDDGVTLRGLLCADAGGAGFCQRPT
jgi:CBS domain-containing protein